MSMLLSLYRLASRALPLVAPSLLRKRVRRGKEDPARWREKLGEPSAPRPEGHLVWLHAVGLGEVLALRGLISAMAAEAPQLSFLITSTARSSGQVIAQNLPPRTVHQFLPVDAPQYLRRFLNHWQPNLSIWAEQDLWPGAVVSADRAGVPLALVNARMNAESFASRRRARGLYANLFRRFRLIAAQDTTTAANLAALGAIAPQVTGSLKAAAPALSADDHALTALRSSLQGRNLWLLSSSHAEDEAAALAAHHQSLSVDPQSLLVIVPRDPPRGPEILAAAQAQGLTASLHSQNPQTVAKVHIVDAFGQLGLWYRLAPLALIGGSFGPVEGHNPWEAAALDCAILHGRRTANFAADYAQLDGAGAALQVSAETLAKALTQDHNAMRAAARALSDAAKGSLAPLATDLIRLMK